MITVVDTPLLRVTSIFLTIRQAPIVKQLCSSVISWRKSSKLQQLQLDIIHFNLIGLRKSGGRPLSDVTNKSDSGGSKDEARRSWTNLSYLSHFSTSNPLKYDNSVLKSWDSKDFRLQHPKSVELMKLLEDEEGQLEKKRTSLRYSSITTLNSVDDVEPRFCTTKTIELGENNGITIEIKNRTISPSGQRRHKNESGIDRSNSPCNLKDRSFGKLPISSPVLSIFKSKDHLANDQSISFRKTDTNKSEIIAKGVRHNNLNIGTSLRPLDSSCYGSFIKNSGTASTPQAIYLNDKENQSEDSSNLLAGRPETKLSVCHGLQKDEVRSSVVEAHGKVDSSWKPIQARRNSEVLKQVTKGADSNACLAPIPRPRTSLSKLFGATEISYESNSEETSRKISLERILRPTALAMQSEKKDLTPPWRKPSVTLASGESQTNSAESVKPKLIDEKQQVTSEVKVFITPFDQLKYNSTTCSSNQLVYRSGNKEISNLAILHAVGNQLSDVSEKAKMFDDKISERDTQTSVSNKSTIRIIWPPIEETNFLESSQKDVKMPPNLSQVRSPNLSHSIHSLLKNEKLQRSQKPVVSSRVTYPLQTQQNGDFKFTSQRDVESDTLLCLNKTKIEAHENFQNSKTDDKNDLKENIRNGLKYSQNVLPPPRKKKVAFRFSNSTASPVNSPPVAKRSDNVRSSIQAIHFGDMSGDLLWELKGSRQSPGLTNSTKNMEGLTSFVSKHDAKMTKKMKDNISPKKYLSTAKPEADCLEESFEAESNKKKLVTLNTEEDTDAPFFTNRTMNNTKSEIENCYEISKSEPAERTFMATSRSFNHRNSKVRDGEEPLREISNNNETPTEEGAHNTAEATTSKPLVKSRLGKGNPKINKSGTRFDNELPKFILSQSPKEFFSVSGCGTESGNGSVSNAFREILLHRKNQKGNSLPDDAIYTNQSLTSFYSNDQLPASEPAYSVYESNKVLCPVQRNDDQDIYENIQNSPKMQSVNYNNGHRFGNNFESPADITKDRKGQCGIMLYEHPTRKASILGSTFERSKSLEHHKVVRNEQEFRVRSLPKDGSAFEKRFALSIVGAPEETCQPKKKLDSPSTPQRKRSMERRSQKFRKSLQNDYKLDCKAIEEEKNIEKIVKVDGADITTSLETLIALNKNETDCEERRTSSSCSIATVKEKKPPKTYLSIVSAISRPMVKARRKPFTKQEKTKFVERLSQGSSADGWSETSSIVHTSFAAGEGRSDRQSSVFEMPPHKLCKSITTPMPVAPPRRKARKFTPIKAANGKNGLRSYRSTISLSQSDKSGSLRGSQSYSDLNITPYAKKLEKSPIDKRSVSTIFPETTCESNNSTKGSIPSVAGAQDDFLKSLQQLAGALESCNKKWGLQEQ
ncbi:uncharacterized protein LOC136026049 isoform X2 [Artemia franciscana]|uniref:uncharacterized protein LOC136026049 isoform X2 n=1 Tax=Artemia franciscana TaxID=6661 RepID=UPI0032D9EB63